MSIGSTTNSLMTTAGIEKLVTQMTARESQPISRMETQKGDLDVKRAIYGDIQTKLSALRSSVQAITGTSGAINTFATSFSTSDIMSASVTDSSLVSPANYAVTVNQLALADRYASTRYASGSTVALGLSGTLTLGGASENSVSAENPEANTTVSDFSVTSSIRDGETELSSGQYFVEVQDNAGTWQYRVVDSTGTAVSIDDSSDSGTLMSSGWQNLSTVAGKTIDTGRGLKIQFGSVDDYQAGLKDAGAASVTYAQQYEDVNITVATTDTLEDIRDAINAGGYASDQAAVATIVDNTLVLSSANTGADAALSITDGVGLGFLDPTDSDSNGVPDNHLQVAQDASLTVNGLAITRSKNTGLDDIVSGLSFDISAVGSTDLSIKRDDDNIVSKVKSFLTAANALISHLKLKTEPQLDETATSDNPTYTAAPLARDYSMRELRLSISSDVLSNYSAAASGAPRSLLDLGVSIGEDNVSFELSDSSALSSGLTDNFDDVSALLNDVLGKIEDRADIYLDGTSAILTTSQEDIDTRVDILDNRISDYKSRLTLRQEAVRKQLYAYQSQLMTMQYQFQSTQAAMYGNINVTSQQY